MAEETAQQYRERIARLGGAGRAKALSRARRLEIAQIASKAAAQARQAKARARLKAARP